MNYLGSIVKSVIMDDNKSHKWMHDFINNPIQNIVMRKILKCILRSSQQYLRIDNQYSNEMLLFYFFICYYIDMNSLTKETLL